MTLTTREDVIKAGYKAIETRGEPEYWKKLKKRVEEYGQQKKSIEFAIKLSFWWEDLEKNFSTITIEKFNDSLSNLP